MFSATLAIQASASRVMFSMARDNRLPFGKFLAKVNKRTGTPVITGIAVSLLAILVLLVNLGQSSVFAAIASVSVVIVYLAYLMVTVPALIHRLRGTSLSYGPPVMDLGKWGIPVNLIAVVMGGLLVVNIGWPRQEVYNPAGDSVVPAVLRADLHRGHAGRRLRSPTGWSRTARARRTRPTRWSARRSSVAREQAQNRMNPAQPVRLCVCCAGWNRRAQVNGLSPAATRSPSADQPAGRIMQPLTGFPVGLAGQVARVGALDDDRQLEAGHRHVPVQVLGGPAAGIGVGGQQFGCGWPVRPARPVRGRR